MKRLSIYSAACFTLLNLTAAQGQTSFEISFANFVSSSDFDGTNSSVGSWYDGKEGLVFTSVFSDGTKSVGATLAATSAYSPRNEGLNGTAGTNDVQINQRRDNSVSFTLSLFDEATGNLIDSSFLGGEYGYSLSFYDIDGIASEGLDQITSYDHSSYLYLKDSLLDVTTSGNSVTATANGTINDIPNPSSSTVTLTAAQESAMIVFGFENIAQADFTYTIVGGNSNTQRNAFIDGGDFTTFAGETIPEPTSALLIGLGSIALLVHRGTRA
ncbi:PEP-CTERM sorting domain-containing protein [Luteolibacter sp. AS25]|uniref:PEP-CTERM sorting domain-containing protein n=1 Tax=Luteolibacter sp. AS25 TaxID=3135776 RepID=UPI00398B08D3